MRAAMEVQERALAAESAASTARALDAAQREAEAKRVADIAAQRSEHEVQLAEIARAAQRESAALRRGSVDAVAKRMDLAASLAANEGAAERERVVAEEQRAHFEGIIAAKEGAASVAGMEAAALAAR